MAAISAISAPMIATDLRYRPDCNARSPCGGAEGALAVWPESVSGCAEDASRCPCLTIQLLEREKNCAAIQRNRKNAAMVAATTIVMFSNVVRHCLWLMTREIGRASCRERGCQSV